MNCDGFANKCRIAYDVHNEKINDLVMRSACGAEFQNYTAYIYETVSAAIFASVGGKDFELAGAVASVIKV